MGSDRDRRASEDALLAARRSVSRRVDAALAGHPAVSSVLVFGSVASGWVDERSDVDLLVVCRSGVPPVDERRARLSAVGSGWLFADRSDANPLFADRDSDGVVGGVQATVHYQTRPWIDSVLDQVLGAGAISTPELPFRPYTLPALLRRSWLLRDEDGFVAACRTRSEVYPTALRENICARFVPVLRSQAEDLLLCAERGLGPRPVLHHLDRATDALVSLLLALNGVYDPADKRTFQAVLPTLPWLPAGCVETLTDVLQGPFDAAGARRRATAFDRLAAEVLEAASQE
jgi:hypothetical protein